jgi:hypothetical protein
VHPLRAGRRTLARDRRGRERVLELSVVVARTDASYVQEAPAAQVARDAPHHALEHFTDLARSQVAEAVKDQIPAAFAVGAVQQDHVQMRVELEIARGALHDGDRRFPTHIVQLVYPQ